MQLSPATTEHGITKFNPFINSPPLTADVDTNRLLFSYFHLLAILKLFIMTYFYRIQVYNSAF